MPDDDPELTPDQEQEVRRLLADARHDEPAPADVTARLDHVLARLRAGESPDPVADAAPQAIADPVDLEGHRRRRRAVRLLVAAAAVVVVGVGISNLVDSSGQDSASSSGSAADSSSSDRLAEQSDGSGEAGGSTAQAPSDPPAASDVVPQEPTALADVPPVRIREARFTADVTRARRVAERAERRTLVPVPSTDPSAPLSTGARAGFDCSPATWGGGTLVPVDYDGQPAVLAFRPADGETQVVELLQCGSGSVLRSTTLPSE